MITFNKPFEDVIENMFVQLISNDIQELEAAGWEIRTIFVSSSLYKLIGFHIEVAERTSDFDSFRGVNPTVSRTWYPIAKGVSDGDTLWYKFTIEQQAITQMRVFPV